MLLKITCVKLKDMDNFFQAYKDHINQVGVFSPHDMPVQGYLTGLRMEVAPQKGHGWAEMLRLDSGLGVGLCNYRLKSMLKGTHPHLRLPFHFNMLLSGSFYFQVGSQHPQIITPGGVWCSRGLYENVSFSHPGDTKLCGISLLLPDNLIEHWLGTACCRSHSLEILAPKKNGTFFPFTRAPIKLNQILRTAHELFHTERLSICGKLDFESLCLKLLSLILSQPDSQDSSCRSQKIKRAVDQAVDILQQEWSAPPTISSLAQRVGTNECYLKSGFRGQLGLSIGEYVRQQRMARALECIESGNTILETALYVGYSNPSHFTSAFKKFYGHTPSYYAARP